jgi:hypothetical protein
MMPSGSAFFTLVAAARDGTMVDGFRDNLHPTQ